MIRVFPTTYFGSILYFRQLVQENSVFIEAKEHFPKQSFRNRCDILTADGILSLSIPVKKENGSKTPTDHVLLANEENWRARHWRAIKSAYQSAPYFDYYGQEVKELIFRDTTHLLQYNTDIARRVLEWLDIDMTLSFTEEFHPVQPEDPRDVLTDKNKNNEIQAAPYIQVFPSESSFTANMSILDAVMCEGPLARNLLIPKK